MRVVCISASNMANQSAMQGTSYVLCSIVLDEIERIWEGTQGSVIELKSRAIQPCEGCGKCYYSHRCAADDDFNAIYVEIIESDIVFIVSPHYAPIPAKLASLLEKMEQITFLHWGRDHSYQSEVHGKRTGLISHGGGGIWALQEYKRMVNDTIANALETIQMKLVPFSDEWNTGISLPVSKAAFDNDSIFPSQEYDWSFIADRIAAYVSKIKHSL